MADLAPVGEGIGTVRDYSTVGSPETLSSAKCTVATRSGLRWRVWQQPGAELNRRRTAPSVRRVARARRRTPVADPTGGDASIPGQRIYFFGLDPLSNPAGPDAGPRIRSPGRRLAIDGGAPPRFVNEQQRTYFDAETPEVLYSGAFRAGKSRIGAEKAYCLGKRGPGYPDRGLPRDRGVPRCLTLAPRGLERTASSGRRSQSWPPFSRSWASSPSLPVPVFGSPTISRHGRARPAPLPWNEPHLRRPSQVVRS